MYFSGDTHPINNQNAGSVFEQDWVVTFGLSNEGEVINGVEEGVWASARVEKGVWFWYRTKCKDGSWMHVILWSWLCAPHQEGIEP